MVCFSYCWLLCATKTLYIQLLYNWRPRYGASECIAEVSIFSHSPDVIFTKKKKEKTEVFFFWVVQGGAFIKHYWLLLSKQHKRGKKKGLVFFLVIE
jgi:hypothetical protein